MRIDVTGAGLGAESVLREHAERRILFALSRFADRVREVRVRLRDVNGPRGGADKQCTIEVRGPGFAPLFVEVLDCDALAAFDRAAGIARRVVVRAIERARPSARLAPSHSGTRSFRS
jgi:hypothetical protein